MVDHSTAEQSKTWLPRVKNHLQKLATLHHGWIDGQGESISQEVVNISYKILERLDSNMDEPHIFPCLYGGI